MEIFLISLTLNSFSAFFMTGVICLVQFLSYPQYLLVGKDNFSAYQSSHIQKITPVVAPVMIVELFTSLSLISFMPSDLFEKSYLNLLLINLVLVVLIWLTTVSYSVPIHQKLKEAWDEKLYEKLISMNWTRTIAWCLRSIILLYVLYKFFQQALMS